MRKYMVGFILALVAALSSCSAYSSNRLAEYVTAYEHGTLYPENTAYQDLFRSSKSRVLKIEPGPSTSTSDLGTFIATIDGTTILQGIILIKYDEATQKPVRTFTWRLQPHKIDGALAGQGADLASTAVGLALGATEMNPLFGPIIETDPVLGLLVMGGVKYALVKSADRAEDYEVCVSERASASRMGFAFGVNNTVGVGAALLLKVKAVFAAGLGAAAGILTYWITEEYASEDAAVRCFEAFEARSR